MQPLSHLSSSGPAGCNTIALTPGMFRIDFPQGKIKRAVGSPTAAGDLGRDKPPWLSPRWGSCHQHVASFTQPRTSRRVPPGTQIKQHNLSKCQQTGENVQILPCSVRGLLIARWGAAHRELHTRFPLTTTCKEFQYSQRCKKHAVPLKNRYKRWKKPSVSTKSTSAQLSDPTR